MVSRVVLQRDSYNLEVDKGVKNCWKWDWVERSVYGNPVGQFIRKINSRGIARCELCQKDINYAGRGWKSLEQHLTKKLHLDNLKMRKTNHSLSGAFGAKLDTHQGIYGLHPMFKSSAELKQPAPASLTSFQDRVTNMESMVVAFTSENSLSFSLVPKMLELAKTLSDDKKALDSITMNRTTASYKTRFGVGKTFEEDLIRCLKTSCFSLNMDESTSSNYQKVLTILASYFCKISNKVVVRHLSSLTCVTVNSEALYTKVVDVFEKNDIPWKNGIYFLIKSPSIGFILKLMLYHKNLTKDGLERKKRIVGKVFYERSYTKMIMGLYSSVLPLLKQFVLTFEMKEPMIHELHEQLVKLFREFLACYVKPEILKSATTSAKLRGLDISTTANFLKADKMFIGVKSSQVIQKNQKDVAVKTFLHNVQDAYKNCGLTLQNKLPITNVFLKAVSAIHPDAKGHTCTLIYLQKLPSLATNVLEEDEIENYDLEIRKFQTDESIVELEDDERIDVWWGKDGIVKKYPLLSKMAQSLLNAIPFKEIRIRLREVSPKTVAEAENIAVRLDAVHMTDRSRNCNVKAIGVETETNDLSKKIDEVIKKIDRVSNEVETLKSKETRSQEFNGNNRNYDVEPRAQGSWSKFNKEKTGILIAKAAVNLNNGLIPMRLINVSEKPYKLYENTVIANFEVIDKIEIPSRNVRTSKTQKVLEGVDQLPELLKNLYDESSKELSNEQQVKLRDLLIKHNNVFSKTSQDIGNTSIVEHTIDTGDAKPIKLRPYRIPLSKKLDAEEEIRKMAELGIIEPSSSAWCAPIVMVTKKDGSIRFCCDFRKINHVTIKDCQPLPRIDDSLAALSGCRWLSTCDLKSGYWQDRRRAQG
ncbi:uncharacterized protein LOC143078481 [Mytilus galloprovincialis]|uniref:uncharacterized protein LOC143078481 n=1 Tax=Mytilus galloprovincialis TaxID=29158 RepID=UPI003F7B7F45